MEKGRARRIVVALVVVHIVLHAIAVSVMLRDWSPGGGLLSLSDMTLYALFMLGPSQGTIVAVWVILGGGKFLWRLLAPALGAIIYVGCFSSSSINMRQWLITTIGVMAIWAAILLAARWMGLRLLRFSDSKVPSGPFQFYIRDMLAWTTGVAVVLSAWRCLPEDAFGFLHQEMPGVVFISLTLVAAISTFSALARRWLVARIVLLPVIVGVAAHLLTDKISGGFPWWYFPLLLGLMAFWVVGSFLVLRMAGYRLTWRRPFRRWQETTAAETLQTKI
jgi:hypothetical protein